MYKTKFLNKRYNNQNYIFVDRRKLSLIAIINTKHESVGCRVSKSIALIKTYI